MWRTNLACVALQWTNSRSDRSKVDSKVDSKVLLLKLTGDDSDQDGDAKSKKSGRVSVTVKAQGDVAQDKNAKEEDSPKVWLGIGLKELGDELTKYLGNAKGVLVDSVYPNSPAEAAKLQEGDVLLAINGESLNGTKALGAAMRKYSEANLKVDKPSELPKVKLSLLRRGKEIDVDVTPTKRPDSIHTALSGQMKVEFDSDQLKNLLDQITAKGEANVFHFGTPSTIRGVPFQHIGQASKSAVVILKDNDKQTEIRIESQGDEPAKISIKEGDESRELSEKEIEQLPEKLRKNVNEAIEKFKSAKSPQSGKAHMRVEIDAAKHLDAGKKNLEQALKHFEINKGQLESQLKKLNGIAIIGSDGKISVDGFKLDAAKFAKIAEEMAKRGAENAKNFAAMPEQIQELRKQVDELKKQVDELTSQLKAK